MPLILEDKGIEEWLYDDSGFEKMLGKVPRLLYKEIDVIRTAEIILKMKSDIQQIS